MFYNTVLDRQNQLKTKLNDAKMEKESLSLDIVTKKETYEAVKVQLEGNSIELCSKEVELGGLKQVMNHLQEKLQEARIKHAEIKNSVESESSKNRISVELLKLKKKSNIPGIYVRFFFSLYFSLLFLRGDWEILLPSMLNMMLRSQLHVQLYTTIL